MKREFVGLDDTGANVYDVYEPGMRYGDAGVILTMVYHNDGRITVLGSREWNDDEEQEAERKVERVAQAERNRQKMFREAIATGTMPSMHVGGSADSIYQMLLRERIERSRVVKGFDIAEDFSSLEERVVSSAFNHPTQKPQPNTGPKKRKKW